MKKNKKVFVLRPFEDWIVDRLAEEFEQNTNLVVAKKHPTESNSYWHPEIESSDIIWVLSPYTLGCNNELYNFISNVKIRKAKEGKDFKVIATVHPIVPEKMFSDVEKLSNFKKVDNLVDKYHTPSHKTKQMLEQITDKEIDVIPFWVNSELWKPLSKEYVAEVLKQNNIDQDAHVIGSFQRDTEGHDLVSPKLEKGPDIFCEIVENLNNERGLKVHVILTGPRRQYVIERLKKSCPNMGLSYFGIVPTESMNLLYNCLNIYLVTSRIEGGPQAIVEAAMAKCPVISTDVGIASEILAPESIYTGADDFHLAVSNTEKAYENAMKLAPENGIFEKFDEMLFEACEDKIS